MFAEDPTTYPHAALIDRDSPQMIALSDAPRTDNGSLKLVHSPHETQGDRDPLQQFNPAAVPPKDSDSRTVAASLSWISNLEMLPAH
jgi:hypothetical protein